MPEMNKDSAKIFGVLFYPVVQRLDLFLIEKSQDVFLQLTAALARNDLDETNFLFYGLVNDGAQRSVNVAAAVVDVVKIEFEFH